MKLLKNIWRFAGVHSPCLLTAGGLITLVSAVPTATKCKGKADRLYIQKQSEKQTAGEDPKLTNKETFGVWAQAYWPVATEVVVGSAMIILSDVKMNGRNNALKVALVASQGEIETLRETIREEMDEKEAQKIFDRADQKASEKIIDREGAHDEEIEKTCHGDQLCCDLWSGRLFYSNVEAIRRAFNDLNEQRLRDTSIPVSFNDLYYYLDLETTEGGGYFGWDAIAEIAEGCGPGSNILPDFVSGITNDGRTYLGFKPTVEPIWLLDI